MKLHTFSTTWETGQKKSKSILSKIIMNFIWSIRHFQHFKLMRAMSLCGKECI
uniref:Uncharacterized protein n=1 Tax=Populus trichocarpa TaxID=3694 RepID=A0A3N7GST9_POPTR